MGRLATIVAGVIAFAAVACVDLSSPSNAPASISLLQLPELFVVAGDTLRDTSGAAARPNVIAYDPSGSPMTGFTPTFFVTDSNPLLSFAASGALTAKNTVGQGHVIGQIGNVQTPSATIYVTAKPTTLVRSPTTDTLNLVVRGDSASSMATYGLSLAVRSGTGAPSDPGVGGAIVNFTMISQPASRTSTPVAYIGDQNRNPALADTTDPGGNATHRSLIVNSYFLNDAAVLAGTKIDSVIVEARMKYRGVPLANSPMRFVVKIKGGFGT